MKLRTSELIAEFAHRSQQRLDQHQTWFPYPIMIPFGLMLAIYGVVLGTFHFRGGMPSQPIHLEGEATSESSLWFSLSAKGEDLLIVSRDRQTMTVPLALKGMEVLHPFSRMIEEELEKVIESAAVSRKVYSDEISVIFSVDESLRYAHLQPLIQVLANQGITNYAFETQTKSVQ